MKVHVFTAVFAVAAVTSCQKPVEPKHEPADATPAAVPVQKRPEPPKAQAIPVEHSLHGITWVDSYAWLQKKGDPQVERYLKAENAYTDELMAPTLPLQNTLFAEMKSRTKEVDVSVRSPFHGYQYYSRTEAEKQYSIHCRSKLPAGPEEILLDLNQLTGADQFVDLGDFDVSPDDSLLGYSVDRSGFREYTLEFKNLKTGTALSEKIAGVSSMAFANDSKTVFYTTEDAAKRSYRLYRHTLGSSIEGDTLIYEEKDQRFSVGIGRSLSQRFLRLEIASETTSETRQIDANKPTSAFVTLIPRKQDVMYDVSDRGSSLFVLTNDGCRTNMLIEVPSNKPTAKGKTLLPCRPEVGVDDVNVFQDFYVISERVDGQPALRAISFATGKETKFSAPDADFSMGVGTNSEFKTDELRYWFSSMIRPTTEVAVNLKTGVETVLKVDEVPGYALGDYRTERLLVPARDGVKIPVSVAYKKGVTLKANNPVFLDAYGAYGSVYDSSFDERRVSMLDRGVVLAFARIRGGGEFGKPWHDAGRMLKKQTTFNDFIDVSQWLIEQKITSADKLAITGASAGGLLMGAVLNQRPELFHAALVEVPFVDVINTMLDESLPLTVGEFEEWGNPKIKAEYDAMVAYSPYDNVKAQAYPTMLVRSSYNDSQVLYHEPAKWVAKLRATKTDSNPLMLKMEMSPVGHGGRAGRYDSLHDDAFLSAFVLTQLKATELMK